MRATFRNDAVLQNNDDVGVSDGCEPMADDERRATTHEPAQRVHQQHFGLGVERACRFVQNQDRRVLQERACDRQALAFTTR